MQDVGYDHICERTNLKKRQSHQATHYRQTTVQLSREFVKLFSIELLPNKIGNSRWPLQPHL